MAEVGTVNVPERDPTSRTTLSQAKANIKFLIDPKTGPQPNQLRTRAFLRSLR